MAQIKTDDVDRLNSNLEDLTNEHKKLFATQRAADKDVRRQVQLLQQENKTLKDNHEQFYKAMEKVWQQSNQKYLEL